MSGFDGARAIDPVAREGCVSVRGVQFWPPSVVFQTPPPEAPAYAVFASRGSTANAAIRPAAYGEPPPPDCSGSTLIGRGPMNVHVNSSEINFGALIRSISASAFRRAPD